MRGPATRRLGAALGAVLILATVAGCGGDGGGDDSAVTTTTEAVEAKPGGTLAFGLSDETTGWLPANDVWDISGYIVAHAIYDRLMGYGEDGQAHPYLAESVTPNDDFTVWTIKLRD